MTLAATQSPAENTSLSWVEKIALSLMIIKIQAGNFYNLCFINNKN